MPPPDPPAAPDRLETDRLVLKRPSMAHGDDYARMNADPDVMATLGGVRSPELSRAALACLIDHWDRHRYGWYTAFDRRSGRFVGRGGLRCVMVEGLAEVEIGYGLLPPYWGLGLATELAHASAQLAFKTLGLPELVCVSLPTNLASRRVMAKVGFTFDRPITHADLPHVFYRLSADDWHRNRGEPS